MSLLLLFSQGVNASAAITEANDSLVSTATVLVSASSSITEAADSVAATSTVLVSTSASITESADTLAASVHVADFKSFTQNFTVLGLGAYSRVPFGSFAGKPAPSDSKVFVQNFSVLGLGAYSRPLFGSFAGKTAQVAVTPAVGTVGGTRRYKHITRKRWEELLEEIRREEEALLAPSRAKAAQAAVLKAKRAAAQLAEELALEDAEQLAREIVAAERAAKAVDMLKAANQAMARIRDIQARIDEDEDDVVMLLLS